MHRIRKVRQGEPIGQWLHSGDARAMINESVEMLAWWHEFVSRRTDNIEQLFPHPSVVDIANRTGAAVPQFGVVQLGGPIIDPAATLREFQQSANFAGLVPASPPDLSRFAILLEPIPAAPGGANPSYPIGRAVIAGAVPCLVNVGSVQDGFAVPVAGSTAAMRSTSVAGGAVILTQPTKTGTQWLQVALGRCCALNFATIPGGSMIVPACVACSGGTPGYMCVSAAVANNACTDCDSQTLFTLAASGPCAWVSDFTQCGDMIPIELQLVYSSGAWTLTIVYKGYTSLVYTGGTWDCTGSLTLTLAGANTVDNFCTWPPTVTVTAGACAGGGPPPPGCCGSTANPAVVNFSGALAFLGPVSMANTATDTWDSGFFNAGGCNNLRVQLTCDSGVYHLRVTRPTGVIDIYTLAVVSCAPLHLDGDGTAPRISPCTAGGFFEMDVAG